jgi:hypothetical protein
MEVVSGQVAGKKLPKAKPAAKKTNGSSSKKMSTTSPIDSTDASTTTGGKARSQFYKLHTSAETWVHNNAFKDLISICSEKDRNSENYKVTLDFANNRRPVSVEVMHNELAKTVKRIRDHAKKQTVGSSFAEDNDDIEAEIEKHENETEGRPVKKRRTSAPSKGKGKEKAVEKSAATVEEYDDDESEHDDDESDAE